MLFKRRRPASGLALPEVAAPGVPAIPPHKIQAIAPGLLGRYEAAGKALAKHHLGGFRAAVYLVLDRSVSMEDHYRAPSGGLSAVEHLGEQCLGLCANVDDDGRVPVVMFDHHAYPMIVVDLADHRGRIREEHTRLGGVSTMGGTNYAAAMRPVIDHYTTVRPGVPALVIFQTDGRTQNEDAATRLLRDSSKLPIFWQFIGFGKPSSPQFDYLRRLDRLTGRAVDNAGFFEAGHDPRTVSDTDLYDRLTDEFPRWLADAAAAGILP